MSETRIICFAFAAFHSKCIDVWLTKNKKTCPLCNETVNPSRCKTRPQTESQSERTPLLLPATDGESSDEQGMNKAYHLKVNYGKSNKAVKVTHWFTGIYRNSSEA